ncbi:hypothetical protein LINGRAHAP2_LOCUS25956 [Linum grandiflorum]
MKIAKWTSVASSLGLIITIILHMHHSGACYAHRDIVASDQSRGFQYSWNNKHFDKAQRPQLTSCTDYFRKMLGDDCLYGAASLMDESCVDCIGFRAWSGDCWVRYETYNFTLYD